MLGTAPAASGELVGHWKLDEGTGTKAADSSGKGNDGTFFNKPTWIAGVQGSALEFHGLGVSGGGGDYINCGSNAILDIAGPISIALWIRPEADQPEAKATTTAPMAKAMSGMSPSWSYQVRYGWGSTKPFMSFTFNTTPRAWAYVNKNLTRSEWCHIACAYDGTTLKCYLNGEQTDSTPMGAITKSSTPVLIGSDGWGCDWIGAIDDVRIYNNALTVEELKAVIQGPAKLAANPKPADGAVDVPRDVSLGWVPGIFAVTHDVYLGKTLADVNNASRAAPAGVLASQGQTATAYTPAAPFDYGQTYYWRVDEVNAAPDSTIFKGNVWSFKVEPYGYPVKPVAAKASSAQGDMGPEKTIDGSGLIGDLHGTSATTMWLSTGALPNWIQYEFDQVYQLHDLKVWNSNGPVESFIGFSAKKVTIEYSTDGTAWKALENVPEFAKGPGAAAYAANTTVNFGGVEAKFVKLTIAATWGGLNVTGLAEVRFSYVPVQARAPEPASGAKGVSVETDLNWRPGRQAASHQVFFGTDPGALTAGQTVTDHQYDPGSLNFGTTYYWRVNEVNGVTYSGPVWSFTTQPYAVVEDFESYTDDEGSRIYETWIDGWTNATGAVVGYLQAPFAEQKIIHGGKQSMPLEYNNIKTPYYSETERTFAPVQNWTGHGADTLVVYFQGRAAGFLDKGAGSFTLGGGGTDIWNTVDQFRFAAKKLTGNGAIVAKVESLVNTDPWAKVGVMIRESMAPGARFAAVYATPGNGVRYQARLTTDAAAVSDTAVATPAQIALRAPVWVKMERSGNAFSGSYSTDGAKWTAMSWNPQTINMAASPVYIGLCATSHNAAATTTGEFSNVSTTGNVTGAWEVAAIGVAQPSNGAGQLYVVVQDSAGKSKVVKHPVPAATTLTGWQEWKIPLSEFTSAGVKTTAVKTLTMGVGDRASPTPGGAGLLYIDDIGFGHPAP
jgi:hypothetical protein